MNGKMSPAGQELLDDIRGSKAGSNLAVLPLRFLKSLKNIPIFLKRLLPRIED